MPAPTESAAVIALRQWPYQIIAPLAEGRAATSNAEPIPLKAQFPFLLPKRPYCTDWLENGVQIRNRKTAIQKRHLQLNSPQLIRWLPFDIDRSDAAFAHEDAYLPPPNFIAQNPGNGHTLSAYCLEVPVLNFASSRSSPLHYLAAVERGLRRRLGADPGYSGLLAKNPLHPDWRVRWHNKPYTLAGLESWLFERDMVVEWTAREQSGFGRNCTVFDEVRSGCYREILRFKREGGSFEQWKVRCLALGIAANSQFLHPLGQSEIRAIARSIAKWTWKNFTEANFSRRQSRLGDLGARKRWAGHTSMESTRPWDRMGVSRATWYRKRRLPALKQKTTICQMISE